MKFFINNRINRNSLSQLFRYGTIGIASNLTGYFLYLSATYLGVSPKTTVSLLYIACSSIGFWGNRELTFSHKGSVIGSGFLYIIAHFIGYLINLSIIVIMVDIFGYPHYIVQAFAIFVVAIFLFIAFKFFVFKNYNLQN